MYVLVYSFHRLPREKKKNRWKLYKNDVCRFEQILEAAAHKTAHVQRFTPHLNPPKKDEQDMLVIAGEVRTNT